MPADGRPLVSKFFPGTGESYDKVARRASLGFDARWKRRVLSLMPERCSSILELAGGTGILTAMLLDRHPNAHVTAVDITDEYMAVAKRRIAARGAEARVTFVLGNAETVPLTGPFDACVSCYVPKYCDLDALARHIDPVMAPGGIVILQDLTHPRGWLARLVWRAWFGVLHLVTPRLWPEWKATFDHDLMRLIETSDWPKRAHAAFVARGYELGREHMTSHSATIVWARKPTR